MKCQSKTYFASFIGLIAYETQRIKTHYIFYAYAEGTEVADKCTVFDAL